MVLNDCSGKVMPVFDVSGHKVGSPLVASLPHMLSVVGSWVGLAGNKGWIVLGAV